MRTLLAITLACVLVGRHAAAVPDGPAGDNPGDAGTALPGMSLSAEAVLFTGAASARLPFDLPTGRNGMQPNLALVYTGGSATSLYGQGWELPIGRIERSMGFGVPTYTGSDHFVVTMPDGVAELVSLGGNVYGARIDSAHVQVTLDSARNTWTLHDRSGRDYVFGDVANATSARSGPATANGVNGTFAWYLTQVTDNDQNSVTYTYDALIGAARPRTINYTGHASTPGPYTVVFNWVGTSTGRISYAPGFRQEFLSQLSSIAVQYTGGGSATAIRTYDLVWGTSAASGTELLTGVQQRGRDGSQLMAGSAAATETFTYNDNSVLPFASQLRNEDLQAQTFRDDDACNNRDFIDLNGDGLVDFVRNGSWTQSSPYWTVYLNQGRDAPDYFTTSIQWPAPYKCLGESHIPDQNDPVPYTISVVMDLNGDGLPDYVRSVAGPNNTRTLLVWWNTGSGFATTSADTLLNSWLRFSNAQDGGVVVDFIDLNGDGLPDHVSTGWQEADGWAATGQWKVRYNQGGTFGPVTRIGAPTQYTRIGGKDTINPTIIEDVFDVNGDGLPDKVIAKGTSEGTARWRVWYGTGTGFVGDGHGNGNVWPSLDPAYVRGITRWFDSTLNAYAESSDFDCFDITGDGLPDVIDARNYSTTGNWKVYVNTGTGFASTAIVVDAHAFIRKKVLTDSTKGIGALQEDTFDINGDGYVDSVRLPNSSTNAEVWLMHPTANRVGSLATITSPLGGVTAFQYGLAAPHPNIPFPLYVVTQMQRYIVGDSGSMETTAVDYQSPVFFPGDRVAGRPREFRGFGTVTKTETGRGTETTNFNQSDALKGRPAWTITSARPMSDPDPGYLVETIFTWSCLATSTCSTYDDGFSRYLPFLAQVDRLDFSSTSTDERNWTTGANPATPATAVRTGYVYDPCGGLTHETTTDLRYGTVRQSFATFAALKGGCNTTLRVCAGICDRPATTYVTGELLEGGRTQPVVSKTYGYFPSGDLQTTQVGGTSGPTTLLTYTADGFGNLATRNDPSGLQTTYTYDTTSTYAETTTRTDGTTTLSSTSHYDATIGGKLAFDTDANGFTKSYVYDVFGRLASIYDSGTSAAQPTKRVTYTLGSGLRVDTESLVPIDMTLGGGTRYAMQSTYQDPLGRVTQSQETREVTGAEQTVVTAATVYGAGSLVTKSYAPWVAPGTPTTTAAPVPAGQPATTYTYDPFGRRIVETGTDGSTTRVSRRVAWTERRCDPTHEADTTGQRGECVEEDSDPFRDVIARRTYLGSTLDHTEERGYSTAGWLLWATQNGDATTKISSLYDALGRKVRVVDPDSGAWTYQYDGGGRLIYVDDPQPEQHVEQQYDAFDRLKNRWLYLGGDGRGVGGAFLSAAYTYDSAGNGKGRVASVENHTWDARGIELGRTTTTYGGGYDIRGNPLAVTRAITFIDGATTTTKTFTSSSTYDAKVGRVQTATYPYSDQPETVHYGYSKLGVLMRIGSSVGTYLTNIQHDEIGHVTLMSFPTGIQDRYTYRNAAGLGTRDAQAQLGAAYRLEEIVTQKPGNAALRDLWYQLYDPDGNVDAIQDLLPDIPGEIVPAPWAANEVATYDDAERMTNARQCAAGSYDSAFAYDRYGNLTQKDGLTYRYDDSGRPHRVAHLYNAATGFTESIGYDGNGAMTNLPGGRTGEYDALGHLIRVTKAGRLVATYVYDADGGRVVSSTTPGGMTFFFGAFDVASGQVTRHFRVGGHVIASHAVAERTTMFADLRPIESGTMVAHAAHGTLLVVLLGVTLVLPGRRRLRSGWRFRRTSVATLAVLFWAAQVPETYAFHSCQTFCCGDVSPQPVAGAFFYHTDHLGTPQLLTDSTGAALEHLVDRPWGRLAGVYDGVGNALTRSQSPFQYTGHRGDDGTGLIYFGARYYDPALGMFITHDPARESANPYAYAASNPINVSDPSGMCIWDFCAVETIVIAIAIGALAGAAIGFAVAAIQAGINGASLGQAVDAGATAAAYGAAAGAIGGAVVGAISAATTAAVISATTAGYLATAFYTAGGLYSLYGAVQGFQNGQYFIGSLAVVSAGLGFMGTYGGLRDPELVGLRLAGLHRPTAPASTGDTAGAGAGAVANTIDYNPWHMLKADVLDVGGGVYGSVWGLLQGIYETAEGIVTLDSTTLLKGLGDIGAVFSMPRLSSHGGLRWPGTEDNSGLVPGSGSQDNSASIWHDERMSEPGGFGNPSNHFGWVARTWVGPGIEPGLYGQAYRLLGTLGFGIAGAGLWLMGH